MASTLQPSQAEWVASNARVVAASSQCVECGHVGCCDTSPNQHASKHNAATGHPIITSFEPASDGFTIIVLESSSPARSFTPLTRIRWINRCPTGRSGAFKLANSASRIGGGSLVLMSATGTNVPIPSRDVRVRGQSGKHLLEWSLLDPKPTFAKKSSAFGKSSEQLICSHGRRGTGLFPATAA
jgi:Zn-finger in ubiquitin-hydrolases and other protein